MTDSPTELVHLATADGVATVTLDSPHNRNALSRSLVTSLFSHLATAGADDSVRVVVIAATGRVFCSGADLSEASGGSMTEGALTIVGLQREIATLPKPVVCRVQGAVRAGGIGIVAASDVAICASEASFALTEVKLGLAPAAISLSVLPRMSPRAASWAALSGEVFSAAEACEWGLVTRSVAAGSLDETVAGVCAKLATGSAQGLAETKTLVNRELVADIDARGADLAALSARLFGSDAAREAMTAFLSRSR